MRLMNSINKLIYNSFYIEDKNDFNKKKFLHNNLCIFVLSIYLTIEQAYYGFFASEKKIEQRIFIATAVLMLVYVFVSGLIQKKKVKKIKYYHKAYEISFGLMGFMIAIIRSLQQQNHMFELPSIYIAVIYGFAVFFYFSPKVSLGLYLFSCWLIIQLISVYGFEINHNTYVQDIVSNNIIAWIASIISYRRYVKEYNTQQTIFYKNQELQSITGKLRKKNQELQYISNIDALTNIYNRRKISEILEKDYNKHRLAYSISLIIMDVDYFKSINDTHGHTAGDQVLEQLGELLAKNIRHSDKVGRWGGEEFLIVCPGTDWKEAFELAEKMRKTIEDYDFKINQQVTCSFGIAANKDSDTLTSLIMRADNALYKAKNMGRNRVEEG